MKQVLQSLSSGETRAVEVPAPQAGHGEVVIATHRSLVSPGTERMLVEFGRAGWLQRARQHPDKVEQVLQKVRTDGLAAAVGAVSSKLEQPLPLGYSNMGVVREVGAGVEGISVGDRVVSNGPHAEFVSVPGMLCARVPDTVTDDAAAFTVIGAIGLQGVRLAQPTLGEAFVVMGLGLIGLMTVQVLRAHGCRVMGIDPDEHRRELARTMGAETHAGGSGEGPVEAVTRFSRGRGADGVLLTLASSSSEPVSQAARMCRKRGRIVLVGVAGLELDRSEFYAKELTFQVSCSYGPGRYDPEYEDKGHDYPVGFVRWTEQRNFEAVLDMMADGRLSVDSLISERCPIERAPEAYERLGESSAGLGILLEYAPVSPVESDLAARSIDLDREPAPSSDGMPSVSFIGAGNYAGRILIPAFRAANARLSTVVSNKGVGGTHYGRKHGFARSATDASEVWSSGDDAVVVATRHDSHARLAADALRAGKHVFVEKPLALTLAELDDIESALREAPDRILTVGFNRRFAPHVRRMKSLLADMHEPKSFVFTINAGAIPAEHWIQDPAVGGGRIVGEACHFIDLMRHLAGSRILDVRVTAMGQAGSQSVNDDKVTLTLTFEDGSFGSIHYLANGHKGFPKERIEVFCGGRILQLDNFRRLRGYGWPGFRGMKSWRQDKGQRACVSAFVEAVKAGGPGPIDPGQVLEVSRVSIEAAARAGEG